ncbi:MAG: TetR family transcriptional regulator C-terminal domain-containing protein [Thermoleophilia bacterium]|nr:TetR family transcriptional regulator C-terminal domain-containing protein [Thermoleophilia bacterium]
MPRPATSRGLLVAEGSRLIRRVGFSDAGLGELLAAAGLPKGSFYNYFPSKEAFGVEVAETFYAWHDRALAELAAAEGPALARLRVYFERLLDATRRAPPEEWGCLLAVLALEKSASSEPLRAAVASSFARWQERAAELLSQAQAAGELGAAEDPGRLAGLLLHGWEGALLRARLEREPWPLEDWLEAALPRLLGIAR